MALTKYSISKDPTATNLTESKNSTNRVLLTKNPGSTKAYFTKSGGTIVAVAKGESTASSPPSGPTGDGILLETGIDFLLAENSNYLIQE